MSLLETVALVCPYCGEPFETTADTSGGNQDYVEDCPVCCQPIEMHCHVDDDGRLQSLQAQRQDD